MKKLLLVVIASMLSGCALVDAYLMTKYDPNEYMIITEIRTQSELNKMACDDSNVSKFNARVLEQRTRLMVTYSEHIPRNDNVNKAATELHAMAEGLYNQYQKTPEVSKAFCQIKFDTISRSAEKMQKIIGSKPR